MKALEKLLNRIVQRVNINLREHELDISPFIKNIIPSEQMAKFLLLMRWRQAIGLTLAMVRLFQTAGP